TVQHAGLERGCRRSEQVVGGRSGVGVVGVVRRAGQLPAQTVIQRQVWPPPIRVLRVHATDTVRFPPRDLVEPVLFRLLVDVADAGDAADPAGQQRVERLDVRLVCRAQTGNGGGVEDR